MSELTRRAVLAGACAAGCAATVTGCATYVSGQAAPAPGAAPAPPGDSALPGTDEPSDDAEAPGGTAVADTTDIPVGSGKIFPDDDLVITQPTRGQFVAMSATCSHAGCKVGSIAGTSILCPCHGSKFALADGSVLNGPAPTGLTERKIDVADGKITLA